MNRWPAIFFASAICLAASAATLADDAAAGSQPSTPSSTRPGAMQAVHIDLRNRQIRVDCESLNVKMPLEFFCVVDGAQEYESVLRTAARPSAIHFGLLALGLTPGTPAHFDPGRNAWYPPTGPPLKITCEFTVHGKVIVVPAYRMIRSVKSKKEMPATTWVFDGSRMLPDGQYAADLTGSVVTIVNFDLTMIDVPELASNANETLEWEANPDVCPPKGSAVTMIIEPAGPAAATEPVKTEPGGQFNPGPGLHGGQ